MFGLSFQLKAHVELDYPQGGETFIVGQTVIIEWHVAIPHILLNWDLFYSSDEGVTWDTLQMNIPPDQLTFEWEIPDELTSQGKIRIWMDNDGQDYVDISGNFTIAPNNMPPHLDAPANDTVIECSMNDQQLAIQTWLNNHGGMEVTNFCGDVVWSNDYSGLNDECGASGSTIVKFSATDECGFVESNAILTIEDTQVPVIIVPASDMVVESDGNVNTSQIASWLFSRGGGQASDACNNTITWTSDYNGLSDGCGDTGSAIVQFTATDGCNNTVTTTATFTILDRIAPVILVQARDTVIDCSTDNHENIIQEWLNSHGGSEASDLNGIAAWSHDYAGLSDSCGVTGHALVTFMASDVCGNISPTTATLYVEHSLPLQMETLPRDTTIDCNSGNGPEMIQAWLNDHGGASVTDQCGDVTWFQSFPQLPDTCDAPGIYVVSFTAVDECGHILSAQAKVTIVDSLQTGVSNLTDDDVRIFPNPVRDMLTIDFNKKELGLVHLTLFNSFGKAVWFSEEKANQVFIPVIHYPPGVYFICIQNSRSNLTRKVIIH